MASALVSAATKTTPVDVKMVPPQLTAVVSQPADREVVNRVCNGARGIATPRVRRARRASTPRWLQRRRRSKCQSTR